MVRTRQLSPLWYGSVGIGRPHHGPWLMTGTTSCPSQSEAMLWLWGPRPSCPVLSCVAQGPLWPRHHRGRVLSHWPTGSPGAFCPLSDLDALHGTVRGTRGQVQVGDTWVSLSLLSLGIAPLLLPPELPSAPPSLDSLREPWLLAELGAEPRCPALLESPPRQLGFSGFLSLCSSHPLPRGCLLLTCPELSSSGRPGAQAPAFSSAISWLWLFSTELLDSPD